MRQITNAFLVSQGIDVKVKPISILDEDFQKNIKKHERVRTKAAAIEHAVRSHLDVDLNDDPELQASFSNALAQIFLEFEKSWARIYEELEKLRQRIISASQEPTYGPSKKKQMPFFRMLRKEIFGDLPAVDGLTAFEKPPAPLGWTEESQISAVVALTQHVYAEIERELKMTGFWESIPARNKLVADLQKTLLQPEFIQLPHVTADRKQKWPRLSEQLSPIYKWTASGLQTVQSCPRRRSALATNRPTRWATRGAPETSSYAASFKCGRSPKHFSSGVNRSSLECGRCALYQVM